MNNLYITLGEGKNTAVLQPQPDGSSRRITTLPHKAATELAYGLGRFYSDIDNALWDVAVAYDGRPANARRTLLDAFDHEVRGTGGANLDDCWTLALGLVSNVTGPLAGQTEAVVTAVRREVADILTGFDGVLVGGVLWAQTYRPGYLRVALNAFLQDSVTVSSDGTKGTSSSFFDGLDDEALSLDSVALRTDLAPTAVETGIHYSDDAWYVNDHYIDADTCHLDDYAEDSYAELRRESGSEYPYLEVVVSHLRAWMADSRPDLLEKYPRVGA